MLNASKILLLLPDVAFAAELLPQKKPNTFGIQTCAQYTSDFYSNDAFSSEKLLKLFSKLEKDEPYQVVLSDQHFINEIVSVKNESDTAIKEELKSSILPSLSINTQTHEIVTTVLTEHNGETRIQISAIDKALLGPIRLSAQKSDVAVSAVVPLSWALKGLVSLEPSVTVAQLGGHLYIAQHYIGVSHCVQTSTEDISAAIAIIKGYKKSEPSTMTAYALTNELLESSLKEGLKQTLPIQQMTVQTTEADQLPAATISTLEFIARSLSIPDFPIPQFNLGKSTQEEMAEFTKATASVELSPIEKEPKSEKGEAMTAAQTSKKDSETKTEKAGAKTATPTESKREDQTSDLPKPTNLEVKNDDGVSVSKAAIITPTIATISGTGIEAPKAETSTADLTKSEPLQETDTANSNTNSNKSVSMSSASDPKPATSVPVSSTTQAAIDLTQFAGGQSSTGAEPLKPVQSKDGGKPMMKMILITLGIFIITVGVGVGVGLLILRFSGKPAQSTPTVTVQPTPQPTAMPDEAMNSSESALASGSAEATVSASTTKPEKRTEKVLVVNATSKAGYAGTIKDKLVAGGFTNSSAGNAKGTYEDKGNFVYLKASDATLIDDLEKATGLTLTEDQAIGKTEDAAGTYAVVIVLNE